MGLWEDFADASTTFRRKASSSSTGSANVRRAKRAVDAGRYRKALLSLSAEGLASPSPETLQEMQGKPPSAPPPPPMASPSPPPVQVTDDEVLRALRSFPSDSAPGPSLLSASHLKEAVFCRSAGRGSRALQAIAATVNLLSTGKVPPVVIPHLCGATLLASCKKGGGHRPIAVGEVLRRLTSKCLSWAVRSEAESLLSPLQLGVSVKAGGEAIIHAVSSFIRDPDILPDNRCCLLLDFRNAFNSISRQHMLEEFRRRLPGLSAWMECCYGSHSFLHFGEHSILSQSGVQQGDPLGPLGFALTLHPIVERIQSEVPSLGINAWYLDDGTLCGAPDTISSALNIVEEEGPGRGLFLNREKSLFYSLPEASCTLSPDIPSTSSGFCLLGAPIGLPGFCEDAITKRVDNIRALVGRLGDLNDPQMATSLLRSCLAFPKFSYSIRTSPPAVTRLPARAFDDTIRSMLAELAGGPLSDWAWLKASLPTSLGGLNLRSASRHASAAYLSSLHVTRSLVSAIRGCTPPLPPASLGAVADLAQLTGRSWLSLEDVDVPLQQKRLSRCIDEASFNTLIDSAPDPRSRALARSSALPHAGDWLNVVPSRSLGLHIPCKDFVLCLRYWLGLPITNRSMTCTACGKFNAADVFGDHQIGCGGNGDRIGRHNAIRDAIYSAAQTAALAPLLEAPSLIPGSSSRPADVFVPIWQLGRPAAMDVSVISTLQPLTVVGAAASPGYALKVGEDRKLAAHQAGCSEAGILFLPLIVESLGGWNDTALDVISRIGRLLALRSSSSPAETTRHLYQRLSICLWRGNAALFSNRLPTSAPFVDGVS